MKKKTVLVILSAVLVIASLGAIAAFASGENSLSIDGYNLTFENEVYIKYAVTSPTDDVKLLIWTSPKPSEDDYVYGTQNEILEPAGYQIIEGERYVIFNYKKLTAKQMADDIYARAYIEGAEPTYSKVCKYSILQYAYNMLGKTGEPDKNENLKNMLAAMLEYGASAQIHFAYNTSRLANADYYQIKLTEGTLDDGTQSGLFLVGENVNITAPATLKNGLSFKQWCDDTGVIIGENAKMTVKVEAANKIYTPAAHVFAEDTVTPPTCLGEGYTSSVCTLCGHTIKKDIVQPNGHTWGDWFESKPVTETSAGELRKNCVNCDMFETRPYNIIISGKYNENYNHTYTLYEDGTMVVKGSGKMPDSYWNGSTQPYIDYRSQVKRVIIGNGITQNNGGNFAYFNNLESVEFPSTFTYLNSNMFMDSFKNGITEITIPAQIANLGVYVFGTYNSSNAQFTDIIIENPNITFVYTNNKGYEFNTGKINSSLRLYSYGASNNVSQYASDIGATYIDLNNLAVGTVGNLKYQFSDGELIFTAVDVNQPVVLPTDSPWLEKISKDAVTGIKLCEGITDIPASYFSGYTALKSVEISKSVKTIGNGAFSCDSTVATELSLRFPEGIEAVGDGVFKNRTGVKLDVYYESGAESFAESGVTVTKIRSYRMLLIGNSLSQDASDCMGTNGTTSQLYNIIKAMLGENSDVEIAIIYAGAKSAAWHATVAENGTGSYQFFRISDDTDGKWQMISGKATTVQALTYSDWDYVTIQPYANEVSTGTAGPNDTCYAECNTKFLPLSASLPYMLDVIAENAPSAKVYYYLTWSNVDKNHLTINFGLDGYKNMINVAVEAMQHKGTNSGNGFTGLLPVGTAIQNARSTYLATINSVNANANYTQYGLQRDNVHLTIKVGRYIAALTFAEFLIDESVRVDNYTLPAIAHDSVSGEFPAEYTEIAQKSVKAAVESVTNGYLPTEISGYTEQ